MRKNIRSNKLKNRNKLAVGLVSILLGIILLKLIAEPIIEKKVSVLLDKYSLSAEEVRLKWLPPGISLHGITLESAPDSIKTSYEGIIESVVLKRIKIFRLISQKGITIRNIQLKGGRLEIIGDSKAIQGDPFIFKKDLLLMGISIEDFELIILDRSTLRTIHSQGLNTKIGKVDFHSEDTFAISGIQVIELNLRNTNWYAADSLYLYSVNGLSYSDITGNVTVDSMSINPGYPPAEFANRFEYQTDRIEGLIRKMRITAFSLNDLIGKGNLLATNISVESFSLNAFRDKRKKFEHKPRKMLQEVIYGYPGLLKIDSLHLKNGTITYAEHAEDAEKAGYVQFFNITASVVNVTNDISFKKREGYFRIRVSSRLMNKASIKVDFLSRLYDENNTFSLKGHIGEFDLEALNPFYETNQSITLSGSAHTTDFEFTANDQEAIGSLTFLYENLAIEINDKGYIRDKLSTWYANYRLINSNPLKGKEVRIGKIDYERDPERFLFNYSVKALMTGIRSSVIDD